MKIGVTIGFGKSKQFFINKAYIDYLTGAGFEPVILVPGNNLIAAAKQCSGLLLPGGIDIDPTYYREDNFNSYSTIPDYDHFERAAFYAFAEAGRRIFGICRGLQLIAREFLTAFPNLDGGYGGTAGGPELNFLQHQDGHSQVDSLSLDRSVTSHMVDHVPNLFGKKGKVLEDSFVNSMHHQALMLEVRKKAEINLTAGKMRILAWTRRGMAAKETGVIVEAFQIRDWLAGNIFAVQWHPEELKDFKLLYVAYGLPNAEKKSKDDTAQRSLNIEDGRS